jgi:thiosulfate/3-mercaptopyruvate sulfurtransferase
LTAARYIAWWYQSVLATDPAKNELEENMNHSQILVNTEWVFAHMNDSTVRFLEAGWDTSEYESGHIPGAVAGWGYTDIERPDSHDIPNQTQLEAMLSQAGIATQHTVVVYGGLNNLVAAMAFWLLKIYGHPDVRLLDGGRQKWIADGRPLVVEKPVIQPTRYMARQPDWNLRADKDYILSHLDKPGLQLVDVRPETMYTGDELLGITRGGHIPGAVNFPAKRLNNEHGDFLGWQHPLVNADGTFKTSDEMLETLYAHGITSNQAIVTYCVRGGLSTYLWFALTQLLGHPDVREYDRSWAEWGNSADTPVVKGVHPEDEQ